LRAGASSLGSLSEDGENKIVHTLFHYDLVTSTISRSLPCSDSTHTRFDSRYTDRSLAHTDLQAHHTPSNQYIVAMTWASIVAAPPPPAKAAKVGLKVKTKSAIPSPSVPDVDKTTFELQNLSVNGNIEPEGFIDVNVSVQNKDSGLDKNVGENKIEVDGDDSGYINEFTPSGATLDTEIENSEGCATSSKVEKTETGALNEYLNPKGDKTIQWCIDHKDGILDLHSSVAWTKVFQK